MEHQQSRNDKLRSGESNTVISNKNNIYVSVGGTVYSMNDNGNVQYNT